MSAWTALPCSIGGIFLTDEEELEEWARRHTEDETIGPQLYERIFELILRLKGNYIWPAMHVNYFQENPKNAWLVNEMGIVVGTTHCDMLMRSNQNEWNPWLKRHGYQSDYTAVHSNKQDAAEGVKGKTIYYDYSILGENCEVIRQYWRESDSDDRMDPEEKKQARIRHSVPFRQARFSGWE